MQIGGLIKQSLIDFPGKMAAVIFTRGCNFRCGYCHNPGLVLPELTRETPTIPVDEVLHYLDSRKNWLNGVVVTGGEPTIHPDLPDFLQQIHALGYAVKLDTNGTNPEMLERIIREKSLTYIAMDIKTIPEPHAYAQIIGIAKADNLTEKVIVSIHLIKNAGIHYEFRTTHIPGVHTKQVMANITSFLGKVEQYTVNEYREGETVGKYRTSTPEK